MMDVVKQFGLDVYKEIIVVVVVDGECGGEVCFVGMVVNEDDVIKKLVKWLMGLGVMLNVCYEVGFCGYGLYWLLLKLGQNCIVIVFLMML